MESIIVMVQKNNFQVVGMFDQNRKLPIMNGNDFPLADFLLCSNNDSYLVAIEESDEKHWYQQEMILQLEHIKTLRAN